LIEKPAIEAIRISESRQPDAALDEAILDIEVTPHFQQVTAYAVGLVAKLAYGNAPPKAPRYARPHSHHDVIFYWHTPSVGIFMPPLGRHLYGSHNFFDDVESDQGIDQPAPRIVHGTK
jgi:hypothetical protein